MSKIAASWERFAVNQIPIEMAARDAALLKGIYLQGAFAMLEILAKTHKESLTPTVLLVILGQLTDLLAEIEKNKLALAPESTDA